MKILNLLLALLFSTSLFAAELCSNKGVGRPYPRYPDSVARDAGWVEAYDYIYQKLCMNLKTPNRFFRGYRSHPAPKYMAAYLWDTAFISQIWRQWDPKIAQELIKYLLRFQGADGILHHAVLEILIKPYPYSHSQPPLVAWAAWRIFEKSGDVEFLKQVYPGLKKYHHWLNENRRHPDGLYFWIHPYESGIDNSPRFSNMSESWKDDTTQLAAVDMSSYMGTSMEALSKMATVLGLPDEAKAFNAEFEQLKIMMNIKLWDETDGTYYDFDYRKNASVKIDSVSNFTPMVAGLADTHQAARLLQRAMNPLQYNTLIPFPSVSKSDQYYSKDMWRGPVWINMAYLGVLGLDRYGYHKEAASLARKIAGGVFETQKKMGNVYEYYDPERYDQKELTRKKGNLWKQIQLGSKPVKDFAGWSALSNTLVIEYGNDW
jgi:neutral trehalase